VVGELDEETLAEYPGEARQGPVVGTGEEEEGHARPDGRGEHVPLRVPGVSLGAEEALRVLALPDRGPPLEELVGGADRHADADHEEREPLPGAHHAVPQQHLPRQQRGDEALEEMAKPVVGVAHETEVVAHPEARGDLRVGVVAAHDQDAGVNEDEPVREGGEGEAPPCRDQDPGRDHRREGLHEEGEAVGLRAEVDAEKDQDQGPDREEDRRLPGARPRPSRPRIPHARPPGAAPGAPR